MKNNIRVERARVRMSQQELAGKAGVIRQAIAAIFTLSVEQFFEFEDTEWNK